MRGTSSTDLSIWSRRQFLGASAAGLLLPRAFGFGAERSMPVPGDRPARDATVKVLDPRGRIPVSIIVDDSTCLVNLNRFAIPQFAEAYGNTRYSQNWRAMPLEIPDSFVRKFGEWAIQEGVRGKYSIVPFPALVGRVDRLLPGWTASELDASLELVRKVMMPHWDIHPEMVTHTIVVDTKTGLPYTDRSPRVMENWNWTDGRSVDELADYLRYALNILKNAGLPCEGITTPGGFGNRVLAELSQATLRSCRDVFRAEIPHYFRHMFTTGDASVAPRVEYAAGLETDDPRCVVSIIGCAGDWTGGWDCSDRGDVDRFITKDLQRGRMVEVIERGEPAIIVCHWTGIYFNGEEVGFQVMQEAVRRLHQRFDHLIWMKLSEIARYWAARELAHIERQEHTVRFRAPFACPAFTVRFPYRAMTPPQLQHGTDRLTLRSVPSLSQLASGTYFQEADACTACFDLPKGACSLGEAP